MQQEGGPVDKVPFWLARLSKLFIQYLGVVFASIPSGIAYLVCFRLTGFQNASLVIALSIGLFSAYLVWNFIASQIVLADSYATGPSSSGSLAFIGQDPLRFAAASMVLYVITTPTPSQRTTVRTASQPLATSSSLQLETCYVTSKASRG